MADNVTTDVIVSFWISRWAKTKARLPGVSYYHAAANSLIDCFDFLIFLATRKHCNMKSLKREAHAEVP